MGGQLRVHLDSPETRAAGGSQDVGKGGGRKWDIEPVLDRLVLFRSDLVDHEVGKVRTVRERGGTLFAKATRARTPLLRPCPRCFVRFAVPRVTQAALSRLRQSPGCPKRTAAS